MALLLQRIQWVTLDYENKNQFLLHDDTPAHTTFVFQLFLSQNGFPTLSGVKNEDEMGRISYHPKYYGRTCDEPSQGDNFGEISRMLSAIEGEL
jgi:hypothetical protein